MRKKAERQPKFKTAKFSINGTIVTVKFTKKLGVRIDKDDGYTLVMIKKCENGKTTLIEYHAEVPAIIENPHITNRELNAIKIKIKAFNKERNEMDEDLSSIFEGNNNTPESSRLNKDKIGYNDMFA